MLALFYYKEMPEIKTRRNLKSFRLLLLFKVQTQGLAHARQAQGTELHPQPEKDFVGLLVCGRATSGDRKATS